MICARAGFRKNLYPGYLDECPDVQLIKGHQAGNLMAIRIAYQVSQ